MKSVSIHGSKRESVGKKVTKALRNAGLVPCVVYGGDKPLHFSAPELAFRELVYTPDAHTVKIEIDGVTVLAILQDIQFHPVTDRILHIDFYQIFEGKEVTMNIPVHFTGNSRGVMNGGVLRKTNRVLRVKALPKDLPDFLVADISNLKIGSKLYIGALPQENLTLMHPDNTVVCQVRTSRTAILDDDDDEEETAAGDVPSGQADDAPAAE